MLAILLSAVPHASGAAQSSGPDPPDSIPNTYLDETARHLMLGVRAAREATLADVISYTAVLRERLAVEAPSFRRSRSLMEAESASRIRWSQGEPTVVRLLGFGARHPDFAAADGPELGWGVSAPGYGLDPLRDPFSFGTAVLAGGRGAGFVASPLAPDASRHYQFRSGDTIAVALPDGTTLQAVEVTAIPRVRSVRLVAATMWVETRSFGLARVAYRLSKRVDSELAFQLRRAGRWAPAVRVDVADGVGGGPDSLVMARDAAPDSVDSPADSAEARTQPADGLFDRFVNGVVANLLPPLAFDVTAVVVDYQLWNLRHWLPRAARWQGYFGSGVEVMPSGLPPPVAPAVIDWLLEVEEMRERGAEAEENLPATASEALASWSEPGDSVEGGPEADGPGDVVLIVPRDRAALAGSEFLPPPLRRSSMGGVDEGAAESIASKLAAIGTGERGPAAQAGSSPWTFRPPVKTLWLLRWNAVEALSVGTRLERDAEWGSAALTARMGTRRLEVPDLHLALSRRGSGVTVQGSVYRALEGVSVVADDLGGAFATGTDAADYFWAHGVSLHLVPGTGERGWLSFGAFAERQVPVVDGPDRTRFGAQLDWKPWWGGALGQSLGGGGHLGVRGAMGDHPHLKATLTGALVVPLAAGFSLGAEAGGARVWGDPLEHDLWPFGAAGAWLRGHEGVFRARTVWRGRMDLQRPLRDWFVLSLFGDWARAGGSNHFATGVGAVLLGGMIRLDLARGFRASSLDGAALDPARIRFHLAVDPFF